MFLKIFDLQVQKNRWKKRFETLETMEKKLRNVYRLTHIQVSNNPQYTIGQQLLANQLYIFTRPIEQCLTTHYSQYMPILPSVS